MTLAQATAWRTIPVTDRAEVAAFLRTDRLYAAYPLGDLDGAAAGSAPDARQSWPCHRY